MKKQFLAFLFFAFAFTFAFAAKDDTIQPLKQISIMSYNIKMLPRGGNSFLHHFPVKRARLLPAKLIDENPDVIVFQEAFDGMAVRILRRKLKKAYPYVMGNKNRKVISYKRAGGVLIFSKYPMHELESIKYSQCKGVDCMGRKGALLVEVLSPVGKFQVLGTHMQAGGSNELKISQYVEAGALLKRHEQNGIPQFAAGDFNTAKGNPEMYGKLLAELNAEDGEIDSDLKFTSDHLLNDMDSYNPTRRNLIDFVFVKKNGTALKSFQRVVKEMEQRWNKKHKDLSDHNPVILKFTM